MKSTITQYQQTIADILNQNPAFAEAGIHWLCENMLDIEYQTRRYVGQTGIVAIVSTPELTYQGIDDEGNMAFDTEVVLEIIENPTINRQRPSAETSLTLTHIAAYTIAGYYSNNFNNFTLEGIQQATLADASNKLIRSAATFHSTITL